jgi:phosphoribosylanthranilate isomerase
MALKTTVKVSGVNNLSNARYCAGMGVDMLGFDMDTMPIEQYNEIRNWVAGVKIVGETKAQHIFEIQEKIDLFKPDIVELNDFGFCQILIDRNIEVIYNLKKPTFILFNIPHLKNVILDGIEMDKGEYKFWDNDGPKLFVPYNFYKNNETVSGNIGIEIKADSEERPGFSNFENTMDILESLEIED